MILVIGATGNVGSEIVRQLVDAGEKVRAFVRDEATAARRLPAGVELAPGDLGRPETVNAALRGIDRLYLLPPMVPMLQQLEASAIEAAKRAGVRHVVKQSNIGAPEESTTLQRWHRAGEKLLESSAVAWTFVRPTGFMSNAFGWAGSIKQQQAVYWPGGSGQLSVVDPRDIAAVAVRALLDSGHEGKAYDVTGPAALSTGEQVSILAEAIGKPLRYIDVPEEAARQSMRGLGMPEPIVEALLEFMRLVRTGDAAHVSDDVKQVTGRPARTFADWARENAAAFR
jgi:uncharacterized protein YbjT (DUF2867 family)